MHKAGTCMFAAVCICIVLQFVSCARFHKSVIFNSLKGTHLRPFVKISRLGPRIFSPKDHCHERRRLVAHRPHHWEQMVHKTIISPLVNKLFASGDYWDRFCADRHEMDTFWHRCLSHFPKFRRNFFTVRSDTWRDINGNYSDRP